MRGVPVPTESSLLETFGADPKTRSIPEEDLDAIACGIAEDKEVTACRIKPETVGDDAIESVEALSHVGGAGDDEDAGGGHGDSGK